jgi:glycerol-3-phosphate acyltransferase PlsY
MHRAVALLVAYLVGSIPAAYLAGRLTRGIDLRQYGSGNLGATNVFRVLGWRVGVPVFLFDVLKGALPVALLPQWAPSEHADLWRIAYGAAAILGHVRPVFLLWQGGGKGVATAAGVFLGLDPVATIVAVVAWVATFLATGYVSLGSLVAAAVLPLVLLATRGAGSPVFLVSVVISAFVFWTHRANIGRLRRREEHRFARRWRRRAAPPPGGAVRDERDPAEEVVGGDERGGMGSERHARPRDAAGRAAEPAGEPAAVDGPGHRVEGR